MDDRQRDKFYSSPTEDDVNSDYELEPPDPDVLANEEQRAADAIEASRRTIDIDQIYRDTAERSGEEILGDWLRGFRFQFQVKHLLIATAIVAIALTLWKLGLLGHALLIAIIVSVFVVYFYLEWQDRQRRDEADRRREEMFRRARASREAALPPHPDRIPVMTNADKADDMYGVEPTADEPTEVRFQYSVRQLLVAFTLAAVVLTLVNLFSANAAATMLGVVALGGLVLHAVGFQPPQFIVLGWWFLLLLYILLTVFTTMLGAT